MGFSGEMMFLAFLGLLLFGPRKLPEMARTVGRVLADLKRVRSELEGQLNEEIGKSEFEDPTKNLLGSLADGLKALNSVRQPAKAIMDLVEPKIIKEQLTGPSFLDNLSAYVDQTGVASEVSAAKPESQPNPIVAAEVNSPSDTRKETAV